MEDHGRGKVALCGTLRVKQQFLNLLDTNSTKIVLTILHQMALVEYLLNFGQ